MRTSPMSPFSQGIEEDALGKKCVKIGQQANRQEFPSHTALSFEGHFKDTFRSRETPCSCRQQGQQEWCREKRTFCSQSTRGFLMCQWGVWDASGHRVCREQVNQKGATHSHCHSHLSQPPSPAAPFFPLGFLLGFHRYQIKPWNS